MNREEKCICKEEFKHNMPKYCPVCDKDKIVAEKIKLTERIENFNPNIFHNNMTREQELKQAIEEAAEINYPVLGVFEKDQFNISRYSGFLIGAEVAISTPSILRHADPEIMEQAGWVSIEDVKKFLDSFHYDESANSYEMMSDQFLDFKIQITKP